MNRRRIHALLGGTSLALSLLLLTWLAVGWRGKGDGTGPGAMREIERGRRPVLLITLDTTRADRLEPYGAETVATPTLATLARRGVTFEAAQSTAPITLVAHASLLTGTYPPRHGVRNNGTHRLPADARTLAEILRDEGFRTGAFVSAAVLERRYGLDQGFEVYDDDLSKGRERHPRMVADRPAEATVDAARSWLDGLEEDTPFFLWVHFYDPHAPYSPPPPFRDEYRDRLYDGEIAYLDDQIGRLLEHPRLDPRNTVISVVGDHGESLGEHGEQTHALLAYESTLKIPWFLRIPTGAEGLRLPDPVDHADLVPTLLDLLGVEPPDDLDLAGRSLLPLLERGSGALPDRLLYAETYLPYFTYGWSKLRVGRLGHLKFLDAPTPELYDLARDPRELSNLAEQRPGASHDLARDLREMLARFEDPEREASLDLDRAALDRLEALGYLGGTSAPPVRPGEPRPDPKELVDLHVTLERARTLQRDRLFLQAEQEVREVLRRDSRNLVALLELSRALEGQGRMDEAAEALERALALDPTSIRLHLTMASLEARRSRRDRALALVEAALAIDPGSLEAKLQQAALLGQGGRGDEARRVLEGLLERHPDQARVQVAWAQHVELPAGYLDAARKRLHAALDRDPFLVAAWRLLGDVELSRGDDAEAVLAWREGLAREPDDPELHARLGLLLARQGAADAEGHLREAIRLSPGSRAELHVALGGWLAERGRVAEAEIEYGRVLGEDPSHPGALNNRAIAQYRTGRLAEAEATFRRLVEEYPRHADAWNNLSAVRIDRKSWRDAEEAARRALELEPRMAEAWNNLGMALAGSGRFDVSEGAYREALAIEPAYWQARFNLGRLQAGRDAHREAAASFETVIVQVPQYAEAHLELGLLLAGPLADPDRARTHLNAFLRQAPVHPRVAEAKSALEGIAGSASASGR